MRHALTIVTMVALWGGLASFGYTEDNKAAGPSGGDKVEAPAKAPVPEVRAEIHRTLAALVEARAAEQPDQAKVAELTRRLQQLRAESRTGSADGVGAASGWTCPRGGPGMGYGRGPGWGGGGKGPGYGAGGGGKGPGYGAGGGRGRGAGAGRGQGPGAGAGRAPGGPAYVDQDRDGVCDRFEQRHAAAP